MIKLRLSPEFLEDVWSPDVMTNSMLVGGLPANLKFISATTVNGILEICYDDGNNEETLGNLTFTRALPVSQ